MSLTPVQVNAAPSVENKQECGSQVSILLDVSKNLSVIDDKDKILDILHQDLRKAFYFSQTATTINDWSTRTYSGFIIDPRSRTLAHPHYTRIVTRKYPLDDNVMSKVLQSNIPVIFDLDELIQDPSSPEWVHMNYESGIREVIMAPQIANGLQIGTFCILSDRKNEIQLEQVQLIQAVALQVSILVAGFLANEALVKIRSEYNAVIAKQQIEINRYKELLIHPPVAFQAEAGDTRSSAILIGNSSAMKKVSQLVKQVAMSNSSVLLLGETGTGKELIAREIHNASARRNKKMITVNCAALPATLIESELFGHEKGSFTGAIEKRIGRFELANNSTLFLDEVGELSLELQAKLLRVIQEREIERVGGGNTIKTDFRIIAATNRNLKQEVEAGRFRSDLYFRLNVFPIIIPPLRQRKEDIPVLVKYFLNKFAGNTPDSKVHFSPKVLNELLQYPWPGNVRELEHFVEKNVILSRGQTITKADLPAFFPKAYFSMEEDQIKTIDEVDRDHIMMVLKRCNGKIAGPGGAAKLLKMPSTTLNSKMKRLGIAKP
jgi:transcriptional regulator with GAF, ATPase, and Fis domain